MEAHDGRTTSSVASHRKSVQAVSPSVPPCLTAAACMHAVQQGQTREANPLTNVDCGLTRDDLRRERGELCHIQV